MYRVLVTGAAGMVGSHLVTRLLYEGHHVVACVHNLGSVSPFGTHDNLTILHCDVTNTDWDPVLPDITHVIHLAAKVHEHSSGGDWKLYMNVNVNATERLCEAVSRFRVAQFIFVSTVGVYGDEPQVNMDGQLIVNPSSMYATSKLLAEGRVMALLDGVVSWVILRPVMMYGRGDRGNMARMIRAIKNRRFFIPGNGYAKKHILFVEDFVSTVLSLMNEQLSGILIVSNKNALSLAEIADTVSAYYGLSSVPRIPLLLTRIMARLGDSIMKSPFNTATLRKLNSEYTFSSHSGPDIIIVEHEASLVDGLEKMSHISGMQGS